MADFQQIEEAARRFHQKAGGVEDAPVEIERLLLDVYKRVFIGAADLGGVEGALVTQMGRVSFYYRQGDSEQTRPFVLAHLQWHFITQSRKGQLDLTRQCIIGDPSARPADLPNLAEERDADIFATEVLVPLDLLETSVIGFSPNPRNERERQILREKTEQLASVFGVPTDIMSRRLAIYAARRRPGI